MISDIVDVSYLYWYACQWFTVTTVAYIQEVSFYIPHGWKQVSVVKSMLLKMLANLIKSPQLYKRA
jgi:hypothetical protein